MSDKIIKAGTIVVLNSYNVAGESFIIGVVRLLRDASAAELEDRADGPNADYRSHFTADERSLVLERMEREGLAEPVEGAVILFDCCAQ